MLVTKMITKMRKDVGNKNVGMGLLVCNPPVPCVACTLPAIYLVCATSLYIFVKCVSYL